MEELHCVQRTIRRIRSLDTVSYEKQSKGNGNFSAEKEGYRRDTIFEGLTCKREIRTFLSDLSSKRGSTDQSYKCMINLSENERICIQMHFKHMPDTFIVIFMLMVLFLQLLSEIVAS